MGGCASWDGGGRATARGPAASGCVSGAGGGGGPAASPSGRGFRRVCREGSKPLGSACVCPGPPSGESLPLCESCSAGTGPRRPSGVGPTAAGLQGCRPAPRHGSRDWDRGRKRAGLQRGLTASSPARTPPGRPARAGPGRCFGPGQVRARAGRALCGRPAASASPGRGHGLL